MIGVVEGHLSQNWGPYIVFRLVSSNEIRSLLWWLIKPLNFWYPVFTEPDWCSRWPKNALIHGSVAYVCSSCFFYSKYVYFFFKFYLKIGVKTEFSTKKFHTAIAPGQMWSVNVGISSNLVLITIEPGCSWEIPKTISLYGICSSVNLQARTNCVIAA